MQEVASILHGAIAERLSFLPAVQAVPLDRVPQIGRSFFPWLLHMFGG
jgi:hypothetical protein